MGLLRTTANFALGSLCAELVTSLVFRRARRRSLYAAALERARVTGKPLLVFGDPDEGIVDPLLGRSYGCGDACTDITGCPKCPSGLPGRAEDVLPRLAPGSHVVFASCVLEYVDDVELVARELWRVSGGDLFVAHVEPHSLAARLYPGAKRRILQAPPDGPRVVYAPL